MSVIVGFRRLLTLLVLGLLISCVRTPAGGAELRIARDTKEAAALSSNAAEPFEALAVTTGPMGGGDNAITPGGTIIQAKATLEPATGTPIRGTMSPAEAPAPVRTQATVATEPAAIVCSPLELHALEDLRKIVSDPYHPPPKGHEERHHGVDFSYYRWEGRASIQGEGVRAVMAGVVAMALTDSFPYGNVVIVESRRDALPPDLAGNLPAEGGDAVYALYAHMDGPPLVSLGDQVAACQPLGAVGKSGNAGQAHLHLEMRLGLAGQAFTQMSYYTAQATEEERQAYKLWRTSGAFQHFDPMLALAAPPNP